MREPFTQLYVHLVWATWDRLPLIAPDIEDTLYACIQADCHKLGCEVVALNGVEDHLHLFVRMPAKLSVADLVKQVKGSSSHLIAGKLEAYRAFKWQGGYGAFTVSRGDVQRVVDYISRQREHHREETIIPEFEVAATDVRGPDH